MLKIIVAMIIGAGLGAALTHEIMSRQQSAPAQPGQVTDNAAGGVTALPAPAQGAAANRPPAAASGDAVPRIAAVPQSIGAGAGRGPAMLLAPPGAQSGDGITDSAIEQATSFEEAFGAALRHSGDRWQVRAALMAVAERWLAVAPSQTIAALDRLSTQDHRQAYIEALSRAAISSQPELLSEIAAQLRGPNEQAAVVNAIGQTFAGVEEPETLLGVAASLPGMLGQVLERMVYSQIAQRDPLDALARIDAMPPGESRNILLMSSITQLASRDPAGALSWLSAQQGSLDPTLYMNVAAILGQQHPELAAQYTSAVPESARGGWISAVARGMAGRDVDSALNWLATWRNTSYYADAAAGVAQQLAGFDPQRAAQLIGQVDMQSRQGRAAVTSVAMMWANSDPEGALEWARSLPRGVTRDQALIAVAPRIGEPILGDTLLDLFDNASLRDSAAGAVITSIARTDPTRAQELIDAHIANPAMAQRIRAMVEGGQSGSFTAIRAPIGIGMAPTGGVFYSDVGGALPQLTVTGGVDFVISSEADEK